MSGKVPRRFVYQHSITEPRPGRPAMTQETGVLGLSDEQRWLLNIMASLPERWFAAGDFEGKDAHRYTKLSNLWKRGLIERRTVGSTKYAYRFISAPPAAESEEPS